MMHSIPPDSHQPHATSTLNDVAGVVEWAGRALMPGVDPFDALRSSRIPSVVYRSGRGRQILIQGRKRLPFDVSRPLGVRPFVMAKATACGVIALARAVQCGLTDQGHLEDAVEQLLRTEGHLGSGRWGYEFDVQTRWGFYPASSPNAIVTHFAARALTEAAIGSERDDWLATALEAARFMVDALLVEDGEEGPFFCYAPSTHRLVHNANLLAAASVCTLGRLCGDERLVTAGKLCAMTSAVVLDAPPWPYGLGLAWCDNFHTAYDLDAFNTLWLATGEPEFRRALDAGVDFWVRNFFSGEGEPFYYADGSGPRDIHSAATAIDVGRRLAQAGMADRSVFERVESWSRAHLLGEKGTFYRAHRLWVDKRHFVRWGDAHWALAESSLALARSDCEPGPESALRARSRER